MAKHGIVFVDQDGLSGIVSKTLGFTPANRLERCCLRRQVITSTGIQTAFVDDLDQETTLDLHISVKLIVILVNQINTSKI